MIINKLTGDCFANRKEAKEKLGHSAYNRLVKDKMITFHSETDNK